MKKRVMVQNDVLQCSGRNRKGKEGMVQLEEFQSRGGEGEDIKDDIKKGDWGFFQNATYHRRIG